jgi:anti-sigma B factor antagonist
VFKCALGHAGRDAVWIRVGGELDLAGVPQLGQTLDDALDRARLIVVDLRRLTFIDSAGIRLILNADARARGSARRLLLVRGPAQFDRLFDLVGLSDRLQAVDLEPVSSSARPVRGPAWLDAAW